MWKFFLCRKKKQNPRELFQANKVLFLFGVAFFCLNDSTPFVPKKTEIPESYKIIHTTKKIVLDNTQKNAA